MLLAFYAHHRPSSSKTYKRTDTVLVTIVEILCQIAFRLKTKKVELQLRDVLARRNAYLDKIGTGNPRVPVVLNVVAATTSLYFSRAHSQEGAGGGDRSHHFFFLVVHQISL